MMQTFSRLLLILIALMIVSLVIANAQNKVAAVSHVWETKHVTISDGYVYKYKIYSDMDTAIYWQPGTDTFEVTTTFRKLNNPTPPKPDLITNLDDNTASIAQRYEPPTNVGDNIQVAGLWTHFKGQTWNTPHYANTVSVLRTAGYVELTCTCYKVEWYSEKRINHGIVSITVDGGTPVDLDLYDPRTDNSSTIVWTSPSSMINGSHTIRIAWTGRKNPVATDTNYLHDRFVIYTKQQ